MNSAKFENFKRCITYIIKSFEKLFSSVLPNYPRLLTLNQSLSLKLFLAELF